MHRQLRRSAIAAGAALVLLLTGSLAACGSKSAVTTADGVTQLTIGKAVDTMGYSLIDIAQQEGFFKKQGVNVKIVTLAGSSAANSALKGGDIQFAGLSSLPFLQARQQGLGVVAVASLDYGVPLQLIAGSKFKDKINPSASLADRLKTLQGATVGYISSTDSGFINLLLKQAGLPSNTVKPVSFDSASAAVNAIQQGRVDAAIGSPPTTTAAVDRGVAVTVVSAREVQQYANMTYDLLETSADFASKNPKIVQQVATALSAADDFVNDPANKQKVVDFETSHFSGFNSSTIDKSLGLITFAKGGQQSQTQWDNAMATYKDGGLISDVTAPEGEAWTNKYIDTPAPK